MSRRKSDAKKSAKNKSQLSSKRSLLERYDAWIEPSFCASLIALFAARPFVISETSSVAKGDGLLFVMLTLVLLTLWLFVGYQRKQLTIRFQLPDLFAVLFMACFAVSSLIASQNGLARPALNSMWEWSGLVILYLLARQAFHTAVQIKNVLMAMIAIAFTLSCFGIYQYHIQFDQLIQAVKENPELQDLAIAGMSSNENFQQSFMNRLHSREPYATFGLANSLAGFVATWLCVLFAWIIACGKTLGRNTKLSKPMLSFRYVFLICIFIGMAYCLVLTKSRTAMVATLLGCLMAGMFWNLARNRKQTLELGGSILKILKLIILACGIIAFFPSLLQSKALEPAWKSIQYRLQYWIGSLELIAQDPWFGCGPGGFQDAYTQVKVATASEEVADPHQFLLEIAVVAGIPSLIFFCLMLASLTYKVRSAIWFDDEVDRSTEENEIGDGQEVRDNSQIPFWKSSAFIGSITGIFLGASIAATNDFLMPLSQLVVAVMLMSLAVWLFQKLLGPTTIKIWIPVVGWMVMLINLSGAGGIGFPSVAGSLWLLLALSLNLTEHSQSHKNKLANNISGENTSDKSLSKVWISALMLVSLGLMVTCYWTSYLPGVQSKLALKRAEEQPREREKLLLQAANADPYALEPTLLLAGYFYEKWHFTEEEQDFEQFEYWVNASHALRPRSAALWLSSGTLYLQIAVQHQRSELLEKAKENLLKTIKNYPNRAEQHAYLALVYQQQSNFSQALAEAKLALKLDTITPHSDKKISDELRNRMQRIELEPSNIQDLKPFYEENRSSPKAPN